MATFLRGRDNHLRAVIFVLALSFEVTGCSPRRIEQPPSIQTAISADVAPGSFLIDIAEPGRPTHYWQYEVRPSTGSVRKTKEETSQDWDHGNIPHVFLKPAGAIDTCDKKPEALSPDGKYLAYCMKSLPRTSGADEFFLVDSKTHQILYDWKPGRTIRGFAWAPNSQSVALLNTSEYHTKGFVHPLSHDTILLNILDVNSANITEYEIRREVFYAFARILNWSE